MNLQKYHDSWPLDTLKSLLPFAESQVLLTRTTPAGLAYVQDVLWFLTLLGLIYIIGKCFVYNVYLHPASQLPGPSIDPFFPLFGNLRQIASKETGVIYREWTAKYGSIFRFFVDGNTPTVFVSDPGLIKYIVTHEEYEFSRPPELKEFYRFFTGKGLFGLDGNMHRSRRKMIYPAFGLSSVRNMTPSIISPTQQLVCHLWKHYSYTPTEIALSDIVSSLTMEVLGNTGFGQKFNCLMNPNEHILSRSYASLMSVDSPLIGVLITRCPWILRTPYPRALYVRRIMGQVKEEIRKIVMDTASQPDLHERTDILALLLQQVDEATGKSLTIEDIQEECLLILGAGYETTSTAIVWCLYELAKDQDAQDRLRLEIQQALPHLSPDDEHITDMPSYDTISHLPYLNNVLKESLRITPPAVANTRMSTKDFIWDNKVYHKGTRFVTSCMVTHFDKSLWGDDADLFLPSRWDRAPANNVKAFVYSPFASGPRNCLGYRFATIVVKVALALLIRNFKFTTIPGFKVHKGAKLTVQAYPGMRMMVEKVDS